MITALLAAAAVATTTVTIDADELMSAPIFVWNPLAARSPVASSSIAELVAESVRRLTPYAPRVIEATATDCKDTLCFLGLARFDAPERRARLGPIFDLRNRRSRDGAVVSLALRSPAKYFDAMASGVSIAEAETVATATVVVFMPAARAEQLPIGDTIARFVEAGLLEGGSQGALILELPSAGWLSVAPMASVRVGAGSLVVRGLQLGRRELSLELEGFDPYAETLDVNGELRLEPKLEPSKTGRWWAKRVTLAAGALAVVGAAILLVVDAAALTPDTYCWDLDPCAPPPTALPAISAGLAGLGVVGVAGALSSDEDMSPWWWGGMVAAGVLAGGVVAATR